MNDKKTLYYFNILHSDDEIGIDGCVDQQRYHRVWKDIITKVSDLHPVPTKMYNDTIWIEDYRSDSYTLYPPANIPQVLSAYNLCDGYNKTILLDLAAKGVSLIPCESKELLLQGFRLDEECLKKEEEGSLLPIDHAKRLAILMSRNQFIARVISETLEAGQHGILFLGLFHNVRGMMTNQLTRLGLSVIELNSEEQVGQE